MVVGGQHAELALTDLSNPCHTQVTYVGGSINNYVMFDQQRRGHRHKDSGYVEEHHPSHVDTGGNNSSETQILVCNNDCKVRVVSIPNINVITEIQLPTAINNGKS